jgi:hypothetical protein
MNVAYRDLTTSSHGRWLGLDFYNAIIPNLCDDSPPRSPSARVYSNMGIRRV